MTASTCPVPFRFEIWKATQIHKLDVCSQIGKIEPAQSLRQLSFQVAIILVKL